MCKKYYRSVSSSDTHADILNSFQQVYSLSLLVCIVNLGVEKCPRHVESLSSTQDTNQP